MVNRKNCKLKEIKDLYNLIILKNELEDDHTFWIRACEKLKNKVNYKIVDLTRNNWIENIKIKPFDFLLAKPGGLTSSFKQLYDERISILVNELSYPVYPSLTEILIYENKRYLSYWLKAKNLSHPETWVFYNKQEALDFIEKSSFPIVAKTNIGASGSGVKVIKDAKEADLYINSTFSGGGVKKRWGPNFNSSGLIRRGLHYIFNPKDIKKKINIYKKIRNDIQRDFVIFQEFISHDFEWRCVRIGDSFFAHKKIVNKNSASGSLLKEYENPPFELLDFIKDMTEKYNLSSVAIDMFESDERGYLVNEIQCFFGQSDPYQMLVDGRPGRYIYQNGNWNFEEGDFNSNESYDLRIEHVIDILRNRLK